MLQLRFRHASFADRSLIIFANSRQPPLQAGLVGFQHGDGDARAHEVHGDAAAHSASPDDRRLFYFPRRRAFRRIRDLGDFPLGEKQVSLSLGVGGFPALIKPLPLHFQAVPVGFPRRRLRAPDNLRRRKEAPRRFVQLLKPRLEKLVVYALSGDPQFAHALERLASVQEFSRVGDGARAQLAVYDFFDNAGFQPLRRGDGPAREHHVQGFFHPRQPRQSLGA